MLQKVKDHGTDPVSKMVEAYLDNEEVVQLFADNQKYTRRVHLKIVFRKFGGLQGLPTIDVGESGNGNKADFLIHDVLPKDAFEQSATGVFPLPSRDDDYRTFRNLHFLTFQNYSELAVSRK